MNASSLDGWSSTGRLRRPKAAMMTPTADIANARGVTMTATIPRTTKAMPAMRADFEPTLLPEVG